MQNAQPGQYWSSDVLGPFTPSVNGDRYIIHFTDASTGYDITCCSPTKKGSILFNLWKQVKTWSETQSGNKVKHFTGDGAYDTDEFKRWAKQDGSDLKITMTKSSGQNGMSESHGRWHVQQTRSMMVQTNLTSGFWCFASDTATHMRNRSPRRKQGKTPIELMQGFVPDASGKRTFGCKMYALIKPLRPKSTRLTEHTGKPGIFLGYADAASGRLSKNYHKSKGYLMYDQSRRAVCFTKDATFKEHVFPTVQRGPESNRIRTNITPRIEAGAQQEAEQQIESEEKQEAQRQIEPAEEVKQEDAKQIEQAAEQTASGGRGRDTNSPPPRVVFVRHVL
jgi:hypothetical protein